jgi:hypothetical protein
MTLRDINSRDGWETLCQGNRQAAYAATIVERAADADYVDLVSGQDMQVCRLRCSRRWRRRHSGLLDVLAEIIIMHHH